MNASLKLAASAVALALATSVASAQAVLSRSIAPEPVETTVTQTPTGTVVTRRPLAEQPAPLVAPQVTAPVLAGPTVPAATFVDTAGDTVDTFTTRQVVRRAEAESAARAMVTRQVAAKRQPVVQRTHARRVSTAVRQQPAAQRTTRVVRQTRQVALTQPATRVVLEPRERQIIYRTIVEREVIPRQQVIVAPSVAPAIVAPAPAVVAPAPTVVTPGTAYFGPRVVPPIVAADETFVTGPITIGTVLPENVPLYAMPQNVALGVPATRPYSYAWIGGRAYLVDPASGVVVADLSE